jgi:hypothetical protein
VAFLLWPAIGQKRALTNGRFPATQFDTMHFVSLPFAVPIHFAILQYYLFMLVMHSLKWTNRSL